MHLVLVDCYDSFTFNIAHVFEHLGAFVTVVPCDQVHAREIRMMRPDRLVLGPGPGRPEEAGNLPNIVADLFGDIPMLGICLGHQAIAQMLGGQLRRHSPVHGRATPILHNGTGLFTGIPPAPRMTRYHSLVIDSRSLPEAVEVTAWSPDRAIMAFSVPQANCPTFGVQFHPESVLSGPLGTQMMGHFLRPPGEQALSRAINA